MADLLRRLGPCCGKLRQGPVPAQTGEEARCPPRNRPPLSVPTGAPGAGLVRAILSDKTGEFAGARHHARRELWPRPPNRPGSAPRSSRRTWTTRRAWSAAYAGAYGADLRHVLLGALLAREGDGRGRQHGGGREAGGRPARDLVDAPGHAPLDPRSPMTGCRRCRASTRSRTSTGRAKPTRTFLAQGVPTTLLHDQLRPGQLRLSSAPARPERRAARARPGRCRWATSGSPGIAAEEHRQSAALGIFRAGQDVRSARASTSPAST